jgi:hypothetical protein
MDNEVVVVGEVSQGESAEKRFGWVKEVLKENPSCSVCLEKNGEVELVVVESHSRHCKNFTCKECFEKWSEKCARKA